MNRNTLVITAVLLTSGTALSACARAPGPQADVRPVPATAGAGSTEPSAVSSAASTTAATQPANATQALPRVVVNKSPSCGCCKGWVEHLRKAGFPVEVRDTDNLNPIKERVGVPVGKGSCHTAEVGGYFVEGHVPADDIKRLLAEKPDAKGLVLPGMPMGSPGMETPDGSVAPYTVELVARDGSTRGFAQHGGEPTSPD